MIAVRDGQLTLTATDMEIAIVEDVAANISRNGACHRAGRHALRNRPQAARRRRGRARPSPAATRSWRCAPAARHHPGGAAGRGLPVDDRRHAAAPVQPVRRTTLRGLIDRTRFAISTEETRYYLNGIYLHAADSDGTKVLRAVATDGHRLARVEEPLPDGAGGHARRDRAAQDGRRAAQAARRGQRRGRRRAVRHPHPVPRRRHHADQQADRRHLPRIRAGHPARQRQGAARRQEGLRRRGRPASRRSRRSARGR